MAKDRGMGERAKPEPGEAQHSRGSGGQGQAAVLSSGQKEGQPCGLRRVLGLRAVWLATSGAWASIHNAFEVDVGKEGGLWCGTGRNSSLSHTMAHALLGPTDRAVGPGVLELGGLGQRDREELAYHPDAKERVGSLSAMSPPVTAPPGPFGTTPPHKKAWARHFDLGLISWEDAAL